MKTINNNSAVLLISCPDRKAIVAEVTDFMTAHKGNIIDLDQHVDAEENIFFMRIKWELDGFTLALDDFDKAFIPLAQRFAMNWELYDNRSMQRMAVFVSKQSHCLYDIIARVESQEWPVKLPLIISNHEELAPIAERHGIDFQLFPITPETKKEQEEKQIEQLKKQRIDVVILARYMQIVSPDFLAHYPHRVINIHHFFLPAFPGAKLYHSAYARGVKIIGATSHYVTAELDAGPIIEQDIMRVTHRDSVNDFIRKGKDLEKIVLARAIWNHLQHKTLIYNNKTVILG